MGRPVSKHFLGPNAQHQIQATVWGTNDGGATAGYLRRQNSDSRFLCTTTNGNTLCELVNTAPTAIGQATVQFYPAGVGFGAAATANLKVVGATLSSVLSSGGAGYSNTSVLSLQGGTYGNVATINVDTVAANGAILTFTVNTVANQQYTALPANPYIVYTTTTSGTGAGASFNVSFGIESIQVTAGGTNYTSNTNITIDGGTSNPVVTANVSGGALIGGNVISAGAGFTTVPPVAIESTTGNVLYVHHLASYRAIMWDGSVWRWLPQGQPVPPDYQNINYGFLDTL